MSPSMENTPSDTTSLRAKPPHEESFAARSSMSAWRYTTTAAPERRAPSIIDAWFSSSERITPPFPASAVSTPTFAM